MQHYSLDESGSITTSNAPNNRFFIIAGVTATNKDKVKRVFRKAKVNYLKHNPDVLLDIKSEIKGSQMSIEFKDYVFSQLIAKTDIQFNYLVFDNYNALPRLREKPNITFNYLMFLKADKLLNNQTPLKLDLDDRNKSVESLKALEEYLQTKLCVESDRVSDVKVDFFDSANHTMIQIADIFANHLYRIFKQVAKNQDYTENMELLAKLKQTNLQHCQYFPAGKCECADLF
ncbi:TPA: DUF3800 domain-containing protein [Streptococcus suis]|nr:DUF3800 domain-containing protein [Streptococcus suis]HEM2758210.1 DUF3800 domain-containing protein [Streptococcus suis]HEM2765450.1 DUF3800 domain-containing protein [Streptococcus suis]HEM3575983.1 DUF3800 domain-containing protein [Streptococcus suis]HEM3585658.1 DUF3800 domain-containing protein [Streptococcus suis]